MFYIYQLNISYLNSVEQWLNNSSVNHQPWTSLTNNQINELYVNQPSKDHDLTIYKSTINDTNVEYSKRHGHQVAIV